MSRVPDAVVQAVLERASTFCEACEHYLLDDDAALHHRLPRSAGGRDTVANLMRVHHACHNVAPGSIHQNPARSYRLGHLVRRGVDPSTVPVVGVLNLRSLRS